ncbi:MAG: endonuclease/exonuclease/phosphatase family protein [Galbibacter orientalis]|uniref:endonuclease/exonuclease/phosphatase family protein n=1 Tax=Galbibacter orientalis TaxID=453852 RepID=UPI0030032863
MKILIVLISISVCSIIHSQENDYNIESIVFYNVENLYDTLNDTLTFDDDRTPDGKYQWNLDKYTLKIAQIAKTLKALNNDTYIATPTIIGLAEIENIKVLTDLKNHEDLLASNYGIIHEDSPDERGIDVALLYKKDSFIPNTIHSRRLIIYNEKGFRDYTRDQLVVDGYLHGTYFCFIVNHWPSRSGGAQRSKPFREAAARLNKQIIDSVSRKHPKIKIISMGDFNDNPTDNSFKNILRTKGNKVIQDEPYLYNPMEKIYKKGIGSLAYQDKWSLFDQIYFTSNLLEDNNGYRFWKAGVYAPNYLKTKTGKYKGYPLRSYASGVYYAGYSDHFPVYIYLVRKLTINKIE